MPWHRLARVYDRQLPLERAALSAATDLLGAKPGERLLDVGRGTGAFLRELATREEHPCEAVGVDLAAAMLARVPPLPDGWRVRWGDATSLPFPDGSFDVAACAYLLHLLHEDERLLALRELHRVLVPGGRLVTVTPAPPRGRLARPYSCVVRGLAALVPALCAGLVPLDPSRDLAGAGFAVVAGRRVTGGYPSLCLLATRR